MYKYFHVLKSKVLSKINYIVYWVYINDYNALFL
jgi:hypothetical protein